MTITHHKTYYGYSVDRVPYLVEFTRDITGRWTVTVYHNRGSIEHNRVMGQPFRLAGGHKPTKQAALDFLKLALTYGAIQA